MDNFEIVICLMTILIGLSAIADKLRVPYPVLLVVVGLIIGFVPFLPNLDLDPEIVFLIFLPPILYDAATKTSWHDFRREIRPISALAISLVFCTTVAVAVTTYYLVPGFSWALAFVLGAIVSPPDAVAATNITKGLGLNRKVITIIEGESLVNDASALVAYRYAVAAALSGTFVLWKASFEFLWVAGGGIVAGLILGFLFVLVHEKITNNAVVETSLSLLTPYVAYLLAEHFHVSGVLAVVTAGLYISWHSREIFSSQTRLRNNVVWDTIIFLLNGIIFILIGLQMPVILQDLSHKAVNRLIGFGLIISVVTIGIRILWVFGGAWYQNFTSRRRGSSGEEDTVNWKNVLIVAWTGTRGVVSLATALALPLTLKSGKAFPMRHSILLLSFVVILVTLVVQGLTLPLLIKWLKVEPETPLQKQEESDLQVTLARETIRYLQNDFPMELDESVQRQLRRQYDLIISLYAQNKRPTRQQRQENKIRENYVSNMLSAQLHVLHHERQLLVQYHKDGTYSDETISKAERILDFEELRLQALIEKGKDNNLEIAEVG